MFVKNFGSYIDWKKACCEIFKDHMIQVETKCFEIVLRIKAAKKPESFSQGIKHVTFALLVQMPGTTDHEAQENLPADTINSSRESLARSW